MAGRDAGGLGPENQKRLLQTFFFMPNTDLAFIKGIIEKLPNRWAEYAEFLAWAIIANKKDVAEFLISDGASLTDPPHELSSETYGAPLEVVEALKSYRRTPFLLLAAARSTEEMVYLLLSKGAQMQQIGYVGTSRARLNAVMTGVLGAAVFYNKLTIARMLLSRFRPEEIGLELQTVEERGVAKTLSKEYSGCTPLLLAVHRTDTPELCALLIENGANVLAVDWQQNNAMHIAASLRKTEILKFLDKTNSALKRARNSRGETAFSIAKDKGFTDLFEVLGEEDQSAREAEELIRLIGKEEQKKPKKPRKKKATEDQSKPDPPKPAEIPQTQVEIVSIPVAVREEEKEEVKEEPKQAEISLENTEKPAKLHSEELISLQKRLQDKTNFAEMSGEELKSLQGELQKALNTVETILSSSP